MTIKLPKIDLKLIVIVILSVICVWSISTCNKRDMQITQQQIDNQAAVDSVVNKYGKVILTQEVIVTNNDKAIKMLTDSIFNLKKSQNRKIKNVVAYYKGLTTTVIKEVEVPYVDSVTMVEWADSIKQDCSKVINYYEANTISVPRLAIDSTAEYNTSITATLKGIKINKIEILDSQYIRFITLKGGLFKKDQKGKRHLFTKKSIQVQVMHTNPLINITGQTSVIYMAPKKARWVEKVILIGGGIFLGLKL